jgi:carbonic anhydrase
VWLLAGLAPAWADTAEPAAAPAASADASDPMERLRQRLQQRLQAAPPPEAGSPYDLRVGPTPAPASGRHRVAAAPTRASGARTAPDAAWAYSGDHGPDHWAGLCASGTQQSPVDLVGGLSVELEPIRFDYQPSPFSVTDTGRTLQVDVAPGNAIEVQGRRYALQRMTLHRPSEDSLDGRRFEMSLHLEHRHADGKLAVLALLLGRGAEGGTAQPALQTIFNHLPLQTGRANAARVPLDLPALLPPDQRYLMYLGSLSTPPCTEGVLRLVLRHPVAATAEQLALFERLYPMNARPLQPLAGRRILQSD